MVWVSFGNRRRRGWGGGYGGRGYGGYRGGGMGGGGCLRDLFLLETGCCLAEALGCGPQLLLLGPSLAGLLVRRSAPAESRAVQLIRLYQSRISGRRTQGCCRLEPSCSQYAVEAFTAHGSLRALILTAARLLRCRPGGPRGHDPVMLRLAVA